MRLRASYGNCRKFRDLEKNGGKYDKEDMQRKKQHSHEEIIKQLVKLCKARKYNVQMSMQNMKIGTFQLRIVSSIQKIKQVRKIEKTLIKIDNLNYFRKMI